MLPLETLGRHRFPDGRDLVLYHRDGVFQIRIDGLELMTSRAHGSEESLARMTNDVLGGTRAPCVLIGGLGMGYTLRAALDAFPAGARITVAEVLPAVVEWNRGPLAPLAGRPLDDGRVTVAEQDVARLIERADEDYHAIILDVDNGPFALTIAENARLYEAEGLLSIRAALCRSGVLAVWSASPDNAFLARLRRAGFKARSQKASAQGYGKGPVHTVFLAQRRP